MGILGGQRDVADMQSLDRLDTKLETPSGHALWKLYAVVISLIMSTLLGMILSRINEGHEAQINNYSQDKQITLLQAQTASILETQAAFRGSNQQMLVLITRLQDQQEAMLEVQKRILSRTKID